MLCFYHQKTTSSFCVYFHSRFVCGILLEFVFTICSLDKLFSVSKLFCRYIRHLRRKWYGFFGLWEHYFSVNALHSPWCRLPIVLRVISPLYSWSYFCVFSDIQFRIFFLCSDIACCWGSLKPIVWNRLCQNNVYVCYTLFSEILFGLIL